MFNTINLTTPQKHKIVCDFLEDIYWMNWDTDPVTKEDTTYVRKAIVLLMEWYMSTDVEGERRLTENPIVTFEDWKQFFNDKGYSDEEFRAVVDCRREKKDPFE